MSAALVVHSLLTFHRTNSSQELFDIIRFDALFELISDVRPKHRRRCSPYSTTRENHALQVYLEGSQEEGLVVTEAVETRFCQWQIFLALRLYAVTLDLFLVLNDLPVQLTELSQFTGLPDEHVISGRRRFTLGLLGNVLFAHLGDLENEHSSVAAGHTLHKPITQVTCLKPYCTIAVSSLFQVLPTHYAIFFLN